MGGTLHLIERVDAGAAVDLIASPSTEWAKWVFVNVSVAKSSSFCPGSGQFHFGFRPKSINRSSIGGKSRQQKENQRLSVCTPHGTFDHHFMLHWAVHTYYVRRKWTYAASAGVKEKKNKQRPQIHNISSNLLLLTHKSCQHKEIHTLYLQCCLLAYCCSSLRYWGHYIGLYLILKL